MNITESQRRHLSVFLAQVEDTLFEVERLATTPPSRKLLRADRNDFPPGAAASVAPELASIRTDLEALIRTLDLEPLDGSRAREAQGLLAMAIVQLEDAGSRGLRGYGELDPDLVGVLGPALASLRSHFVAIAGRLGPMPSTSAKAAR